MSHYNTAHFQIDCFVEWINDNLGILFAEGHFHLEPQAKSIKALHPAGWSAPPNLLTSTQVSFWKKLTWL